MQKEPLWTGQATGKGSSVIPRWLRWVFALLLVLLVVAFVVVAFRGLSRRATVAPLWTEADLPPLPAASANGIALLFGEEPALRKLEVPAKLTSACTTPATETEASRWTALEGQKQALEDFLVAPETAGHLAALEQSLKLPRFADVSGLKIDSRNPTQVVFRIHKIAELQSLAAALQGKEEWGVARAEQLVRADTDFATTARTVVSHLLSMISYARGLELTALLVQRVSAAGKCSQLNSGLVALQKALESPPAAALHMRRAVIGEYIIQYGMLELIANGPESGLREKLLYDKEDTQKQFNEYYKGWAAFAAAPATVPPPEPLRVKSWTSYATNPLGRSALEMMATDLARMIRKYEADRDTTMLRREVVRKSLAACVNL